MICPKCNGKGSIPEYGHVANGVCFLCNGRGSVASNGKVIRSVKLAQIAHTLAGMTKRQTKMLIDLVLVSGAMIPAVNDSADFDLFVSLGHMERRESAIWINGKRKIEIEYIPAQWFTRKSINVLIDWSK